MFEKGVRTREFKHYPKSSDLPGVEVKVDSLPDLSGTPGPEQSNRKLGWTTFGYSI